MPYGLESRTLADAPSAVPSPSARALIMTFWGDMLLPFGGRIWLGSLVEAMAPLGLDERVVRTTVRRLVLEEWLASRRMGRRVELSMPEPRVKELRVVQQRMYRKTPLDWDGIWRIVVMKPSTPARREALRRELYWQGYATLAPNTLIHPRQTWEELSSRLEARDLLDEIAQAFTAASTAGTASPVALWPLEKLRVSWEKLANLANLTGGPRSGKEDGYVRRLMIAHGLRMAVLRDPALPVNSLPDAWPEATARRTVSETYLAMSAEAREFLTPIIRLADGSKPSFRSDEIDWRFTT
jgi:phenylacetic acid degradation operon negative regulatory protein